MKILLVVFFEKKSHLRQYHLFRSFFTVCLRVVKIVPGHYWIFKQSLHGFFHDYYWIFKQSGHDFSSNRLCDRKCMDVYVI